MVAYSNNREGVVGATDDPIRQARMICPSCKQQTLQRDHRKNFMERVVFPWFHLYPWECVNCRTRKLLRIRAKRRRKTTEGKPR